jgi:hypothetical protein
MITLCIRYCFNPDRLADFKAYCEGEQEPIRRSGGTVAGYFMPTDFAGPTNEAMGLIDFPDLASYERYRSALAADPDHKRNFARLQDSGAEVAMNRVFIERIGRA